MCFLHFHIHQNPKCSVYWLFSILYILYIQSSGWMNFLAYHFVCSIEHQVVNLPFFLILIDFYIERPTEIRAQTNSFHSNTQVNITKINDEENFFLYFSSQIKVVISLESRVHIVNNNNNNAKHTINGSVPCIVNIFCVVILLLFWLNFHLIGYHTPHT